jgi:hypothetical protein
METQFDNQKERSSRTLVIVALVLMLGGLVYFISQNQTVHFSNKAAGAAKLDESQVKQVMVLGYSQSLGTGATHKLRIEVPHAFAFVPQSVSVGTVNSSLSPKKVSFTENAYECHDMGDPDHPMMGYETSIFTDSLGEDMDTKFYVTFTDAQGKQYEGTFDLEHSCTVFGKGSVQQISPPAVNDVPEE